MPRLARGLQHEAIAEVMVGLFNIVLAAPG
jgi:hypothetical protein